MSETIKNDNFFIQNVKSAAKTTVEFHPILTAQALKKTPSKLKNLATDVFESKSLKTAIDKRINKDVTFKSVALDFKDKFVEFFKKGIKNNPTEIESQTALQVVNNNKKTIFSKIGSVIAKPFKVLAEKIAPVTSVIGKVTKPIGKFLSKHGIAVINAVIVLSQVFSKKDEIKEAFKENGAKGGIKKIAQVALPSVANIAGFSVGMAAGGALFGAIGSVVPVVGTALGVAFGQMLGGLLFSGLSEKATNKVLGNKEEVQQETTNSSDIQMEDIESFDKTNAKSYSQLSTYDAQNPFVLNQSSYKTGDKELDELIVKCLS